MCGEGGSRGGGGGGALEQRYGGGAEITVDVRKGQVRKLGARVRRDGDMTPIYTNRAHPADKQSPQGKSGGHSKVEHGDAAVPTFPSKANQYKIAANNCFAWCRVASITSTKAKGRTGTWRRLYSNEATNGRVFPPLVRIIGHAVLPSRQSFGPENDHRNEGHTCALACKWSLSFVGVVHKAATT